MKFIYLIISIIFIGCDFMPTPFEEAPMSKNQQCTIVEKDSLEVFGYVFKLRWGAIVSVDSVTWNRYLINSPYDSCVMANQVSVY